MKSKNKNLSERVEKLYADAEARMEELNIGETYTKAGPPHPETIEAGVLALSLEYVTSIKEAIVAYEGAVRERNLEDSFRIAQYMMTITELQGKNYSNYMAEVHTDEAILIAKKILVEELGL